MIDYVSPFASEFPKLPAIAGVRLASSCTGMRYEGRDDIMLITLAEGSAVGGVLTTNKLCGNPVDWCRKILPIGSARAVIVNAGIANVFTGAKGKEVCEGTANHVAELLGCKPEEIYVSSTGVIGELPDGDKIKASLPALKDGLSEEKWEDAAKAFMTTDTFPKGVTRTAEIGGTKVTLNGIIKGSGMIEPNMATMLGYVFTDAKIPASVLQELISEDVKYTYNCMTVDSDTSTSDTVLTLATGKAEHVEITSATQNELEDFKQKHREIHEELAKLVAKDGEGLTKFVTINVKGAQSFEAARTIAKSIANSPLVKTALTGEDPNWGRICMAIGKSGENAERDKTSIWVGDILIAENGEMYPDYVEAKAAEYMKNPEIDITANVGVGEAEATVWTMDLTHDYIKINTDYRS